MVRSRHRSKHRQKTPARDSVLLTGFLGYMDSGTDAWNTRGLQALRFLLLLHAAVRTWSWVVLRLESSSGWGTMGIVMFALAMSAAAALVLSRRFARAGVALAAFLLTLELISSFPGTPNHVFLEYVVVLAYLLLDPTDEEEGHLLLSALRWVTAIVFFYTGFQKLAGGYYVNGEYLAWATAIQDRFAALFAWLLTTEELQRLRALDGTTPGTGPYRADSVAFLLTSNVVWIAEMVLGLLFIDRRMRGLATVAALCLLLVIQISAREIMFALLFSQLLLLFLDGDWNRRAGPVFLFSYVYILAYLAGLVPGDFLARGATGL